MVLSGKVVENLMVDVQAKNVKLKERCARIVTELSSKTFDEAWELLENHGWNIREVLAEVRPAPRNGQAPKGLIRQDAKV